MSFTGQFIAMNELETLRAKFAALADQSEKEADRFYREAHNGLPQDQIAVLRGKERICLNVANAIRAILSQK